MLTTLSAITGNFLFQGVAGNVAYKGLEVATEAALKQLKNLYADGELPANHDLLKAVRIASLQATHPQAIPAPLLPPDSPLTLAIPDYRLLLKLSKAR